MVIIQSKLLQSTIFSSNDCLYAEFLYPKVVLFGDTQSFHIVDLEATIEDHLPRSAYKLNHDIIDKLLLNHILWLILKSGEIIAVDILSGGVIKILCDNFKVCGIKGNKTKLYFVSASGELLAAPYNTQDLLDKMKDGITELSVSLQKAGPNNISLQSNMSVNAQNAFVENGVLNMKCPVTGLLDTISLDVPIENMLPWEDMVIVTNKSNMWLMDLKESQTIHEFKNSAGNVYPLAVYNNLLYYLLTTTEEVQIYCASSAINSSVHLNDNKGSFNGSICAPSSQDTLKSQLEFLVDSILSADKSVKASTQLDTLFESIHDFAFLIDMSLKLCQYDILYKSVLYPLQKNVHAEGDKGLIYKVCDLIIKIDLLEYINFRGNHLYENVNLLEKSFKDLCIAFISKSDLDLASICWLKYSEMELDLSNDDILDILNAIPHNTKMGAIIIWLRNFVPRLLEKNPFRIDLFVRWSTERVFKLEQSAYWPKIGIKFLEEIITVLEKSLKTISVRPISIDDLDILKDRIIYILELKEKYKINMLLSEFSSQSPCEVAIIMLRRCYTEDLEAFLQNYLSSYANRHMFDLDDVLRSFIEIEAARSGGEIDGVRLNMLLNAFRSLSSKLDCLLQVLKVLNVPWNSTVLDLAVAAVGNTTTNFTVSDTDRILAQEIQKEINYANVKVVLKKYNFPLLCTDYILVLHKVVNAPTVDMNDLKVITSVMHLYAHYGHTLYLSRCIQDCDTKTALNYFKNLTTIIKNLLLKTMITKYEQIINGNTNNKTIERNYIDFIKGTELLNETEMQNIENLYYLKNSYNIKLDINNIHIENFGGRCTVDSQKSDDGEKIASEFTRDVIQMTRTCQSRKSMLLSLLHRTSTSHRVRLFIESLISSSLTTNSNHGRDIKTILSKFCDGQNSILLLESWKVLVELVTHCREEHMYFTMKYLSILNALVNTNIVVKNLSIAWKFHYIYLPISSAPSINELIRFYEEALSTKTIETEYPNIYNKCDFIPFRMISYVETNLAPSGQKIRGDFMGMKAKMARRLLSNIVASLDLDDVLIMSLLLILKTVEITEDNVWIPEVLRGQNDVLPPAVSCYLSSPPIGVTFTLDTNVIGNTVSYPPQYILKSKFNINLSEIALPEHTEDTWDVKVILFYVLRQYPNTSYERLSELCYSLNISTNDGLSLQLISLLTNWNLKYKIFKDEFNCRQIVLENDETISNKCISIWHSIENKDFLKDVLNDFWRNGEITLHGRVVSINPYYYEMFICIYSLIFESSMDSNNLKEYFLLNFLKDYKRRSAPKQYELELFSIKGMFPEIGHFRLPFHLFMRDDMWSNLKSEITLETYERWIPTVALLSLDSDLQTAKDMICSNALKQTMTSRKRNDGIEADSKDTEPWCLTTREEPLLRAAHRCVRHIANMEWAGACLFYVLQGCNRGADQVAAAHLCYQFAQRWAAFQPGNRAVRQMERLHATLSTRHALHKIEWACEEFLRLSTEPAQLIRALYLHPDFVQKMSRHDVNRAANEIADKNAINVSSIRIQILENILEKARTENKSKDVSALSTTELMTVKYILKATCPKMGAIYLSRIVFDDENDHNKCKKLRALQCLMSVVEPETALKVTNQERDDLWISLLDLLCIIKLDNIDMPWIVMAYLQNKTLALEQLLQAVESNVERLRIATDLAYRFGTTKTIHNLIPLLQSAGLYEEMIPLLLKDSTSSPNSITCAAWRVVLLSPFQRADYPITENQRTKCINVINLLPICPVIKDEDLTEIWRHCVRCKCLGIGCLVLPYMTTQARQSLTELSKVDRRNLIVSLKNLHNETYLVSGAMHVVENMASRTYR